MPPRAKTERLVPVRVCGTPDGADAAGCRVAARRQEAHVRRGGDAGDQRHGRQRVPAARTARRMGVQVASLPPGPHESHVDSTPGRRVQERVMRWLRTSTMTRRAFTGAVAAAPLAAARALAARDVGRLGGGRHDLTILYTNDFHSAFDPIPAYWLRGFTAASAARPTSRRSSSRNAQRARTSFLLDSGRHVHGHAVAAHRGRGPARDDDAHALRRDGRRQPRVRLRLAGLRAGHHPRARSRRCAATSATRAATSASAGPTRSSNATARGSASSA